MSHPLVPGVRIEGPNGDYWQRFTFENMEGLCFDYGAMLHIDDKCCREEALEKTLEEEMVTDGEAPMKKPPIRRGSWMIAVQRWSSDVDAARKPGMLSSPAQASDSSAPASRQVFDIGWQIPARPSHRRMVSMGPLPASTPSTEVVSGAAKGKALASSERNRALPAGQPSNPFSILGRLEEGEPSGPAHGPLGLKRARLVVGQMGWGLQPGSKGEGVVWARKVGPKSSKARGKGRALLVHLVPDAPGAVGSGMFHFSVGKGKDPCAQSAAPVLGAGPSGASDQPMQAKGGPVDQEESGGVSVCRPVDHEEAVSCLMRAIRSGEGAPQGDGSPSTKVIDEVTSAGVEDVATPHTAASP